MKQDLLAKGFSHPILSTVKYSSGYLLSISDDRKYICGRRLIRVYKYTKIQGPRFKRNYIIARDKKRNEHSASFQSSPKVNRMLITRLICNIESLQHPLSTLLRDSIRGPTRLGKALNYNLF